MGTKEDLTKCFEEYGTVQDVWVVKDRQTNENRGVAYIKMAKMSEATLAQEKMNGEPIRSDDRPLKVMIAQPKSTRSNEDFEDETTLTRLFVTVPRDQSEEDLKEAFEAFGTIDFVQITKDRK